MPRLEWQAAREPSCAEMALLAAPKFNIKRTIHKRTKAPHFCGALARHFMKPVDHTLLDKLASGEAQP